MKSTSASILQKDSFLSTFLWGTLCFFLMCFNEGAYISITAFLLLIFTFFLLLHGDTHWISALPKSFYFLLAFMIYQGILLFFAIAPKLGYHEYCKLLTSYLTLILFLSSKKSWKNIIDYILVACTWVTFLSLDFLSTRWFVGIFQKIMGHFVSHFDGIQGLEIGVRITTLFSNPNVYAGFIGIGILFSLGMILEYPLDKWVNFYLFSLYINSLGFLLAFSLGGTAMIVFSFFFYFLLEKRKNALLLLMIETFILVLFGVFPIYLTTFQGWTGVTLIPFLVGGLGSLLLCFLHQKVNGKILDFFHKKNINSFFFALFIVLFILLYGVFALLWTGPITLQEHDILKRSQSFPSGDYQLELHSDQPIHLRIDSQNLEDTMKHSYSTIYSDVGENITFTVPEDSIVVHFYFTALENTTLSKAITSNQQELPLRYYLLPGFISTRLQGFWANQNFIQRLVFFSDGMKMFSLSPIFGSGMGTFESTLFRLQDFYYTTKYAHNHYIQTLLEAGILGLFLFLGMCSTLWKTMWARFKKSPPLSACCLSVFFFSLTHGLVEMNWSIGNYCIIMFLSLAVFFLQNKDEEALHRNQEKKREGKIQGLLLGYFLSFILLQCGNFQSYLLVRSNDDPDQYMKHLEIAILLDPFEKDDHRISYIYYAGKKDNDLWSEKAEKYITELKPENSNVQAYYLIEFYLRQNNPEEALKYCEIYVTNGASHPYIWNSTFTLLQKYEFTLEKEDFILLLSHVYQSMVDWDATHIGAPILSDELQEYLEEKL